MKREKCRTYTDFFSVLFTKGTLTTLVECVTRKMLAVEFKFRGTTAIQQAHYVNSLASSPLCQSDVKAYFVSSTLVAGGCHSHIPVSTPDPTKHCTHSYTLQFLSAQQICLQLVFGEGSNGMKGLPFQQQSHFIPSSQPCNCEAISQM